MLLTINVYILFKTKTKKLKKKASYIDALKKKNKPSNIKKLQNYLGSKH
jgi:hypothetical protein